MDICRRRNRRGCGKVGSVLCFPLIHTPFSFHSATLPEPAVCTPAMNAAFWCCSRRPAFSQHLHLLQGVEADGLLELNDDR